MLLVRAVEGERLADRTEHFPYPARRFVTFLVYHTDPSRATMNSYPNNRPKKDFLFNLLLTSAIFSSTSK